MKILHVIPSLALASGGPPLALRGFCETLEGVAEIQVVTMDEGTPGDRATFPFRHVSVVFFPYIGKHSYKFSPALLWYIWKNAKSFDVIHTHAAFSITADLAAFIAVLRGVKLVYRPLGTLSPWSLTYGSRRLKSVFVALFLRPLLKKAYAVHCTSKQEAADVAHCIPGVRTVVIPNPVEIYENVYRSRRAPEKELAVGFLSRLDPKKNLESLISACSEMVSDSSLRLLIAGSGDKHYVHKLQMEAASRTNDKFEISWEGFLLDAEKQRFFSRIDVFVLPSLHENYGIAAVEAMTYGVPVILSNAVFLDVPPDTPGVFRCGTDVFSIREALEQVKRASVETRLIWSKSVRETAIKHFSNSAAAVKLIALYR